MYQKIIIAGYLGQDPNLRYLDDGTPVANFSVATSNKWTGADGTKHDETTWFRVTAWRKLGEVCNEYLAKGRPVLIEGRLKPDENGNPRIFNRKDGSPGSSYELTASTVKFLGGKGDAPSHNESDPGMPSSPDEEDPIIPF